MWQKIKEFYQQVLMFVAVWCGRELGCDVEVKNNKDGLTVKWIKFIFPKEK